MSYQPFHRFRLTGTSASHVPTTRVSSASATGNAYISFSGASAPSLRSASVVSISSDSDDVTNGDVSMRTAPMSSSSGSLSASTSSSLNQAASVDSSSSSAVSSASSYTPRTAAGVPLPVPLLLEEIDDIELWSRTIVRRFPSLDQLKDVIYDADSAVRFLVQQRILYDYDLHSRTRENIVCEGGNLMIFTYNADRGFVWRCHKYGCPCNKSRCSPLLHSFFAERRVSLQTQILILYFWLVGCPRRCIAIMTSTDLGTIKRLLDDFFQIMQHDFLNSQHEDLDESEEEDDSVDLEALPPLERHLHNNPNKIGGYDLNGDSIIVELDESKFGKVKYHRGHRVEGVWVIGGVERTPQRRLFLVTVPNRNSVTIARVIRRHVNRGSTIHTDFWRGYLCIQNMHRNYVHRRVNHEEGFINVDGTHTNTIEGTWNGIKIKCFPRQRTKRNMPWVLLEFIWRRKYHGDLWGGLMKTLREVEFDRRTHQGAFITEVVVEDNNNDDNVSDNENLESEDEESSMDTNLTGPPTDVPSTDVPFTYVRRSARLASRSS